MSIRRPMTAGNSRAGTVLRPRAPIQPRQQPTVPLRNQLQQLVHLGSQLQLARPRSRVQPVHQRSRVQPVPQRNRPRIARPVHLRPRPERRHSRRGTCNEKRLPGIAANRVPRARNSFSEAADNQRRGAEVFSEAVVGHVAAADGADAADLSGLTAVYFGTRGQIRLTPGATKHDVRAGSNGFQDGYRSSIDRISGS